jgi:transcriptional regulator with XRE-family HTH domain
VGERIKEIRNARGWTARHLAERCDDVGAPELTAPVIANIETGRRDKNGGRRREVTVDETLTFALALEVPPAFLFLPLNGDQKLKVTATTEMDVLSAAAWVNGDDAAMRYLSGQAVPRTQEERERWARWRRSARPLDLLRNIWLWTQLQNEIAALGPHERPELSEVERADRLDMLAGAPAVAGDADPELRAAFKAHSANIARLIDRMTSLGFTPPPLPEKVVETMRRNDMLEVANPDELLIANGNVT